MRRIQSPATHHQALTREFEKIRRQHRPARVSTLFVGESRPNGGTFFYNGDSILYYALREGFGAGEDFLAQFRSKGFYLDDLVLDPINQIKDKDARDEARRAGVPGLARRMAEYQPAAVVILMLGIKEFVADAMTRARLAAIPHWALPFPSRPRHKERFLAGLEQLIPHLPTAASKD
jgi:hypothetical protein